MGKMSYENEEKVIHRSDFHMGNPRFGTYAEQLIHQQQGQMLKRSVLQAAHKHCKLRLMG